MDFAFKVGDQVKTARAVVQRTFKLNKNCLFSFVIFRILSFHRLDNKYHILFFAIVEQQNNVK